MTDSDILDAAKEARIWTKATKGGRELPTDADRAFLSLLDVKRVRSRGEIGCVVTKADVQARRRCGKLGWARYLSPRYGTDGWRLTEAGRVVLHSRLHPNAGEVPRA